MLDKYLERGLRKDVKAHCGKIDNILLKNTKEDLKNGKNILILSKYTQYHRDVNFPPIDF